MFTNHTFTAASLGFSSPSPPSHLEISQRAHSIWRRRDCPKDRDVEIWLQAEALQVADHIRPARTIQERLRASYPQIVNRHRSTTSL